MAKLRARLRAHRREPGDARRFVGFYNAQCCGLIMEFQTFDFSGLYLAGYNPRVVKDHRWNVAITLAGIGTFSNIFGALGGGTTR